MKQGADRMQHASDPIDEHSMGEGLRIEGRG